MSADVKRDNRRLFVRLAIVAVGCTASDMRWCPSTGRSASRSASTASSSQPPPSTRRSITRTVTIELDASSHDLPWRFRPLGGSVAVRPGELATLEYEIVNVRERR